MKGRLRSQKLETSFLVADILEDAILGLDFLEQERAMLNFKTAELTYRHQRLVCVDHLSKPMMAQVYLPRSVLLPALPEQVIQGKIQQDVAGEAIAISALPTKHDYLVGSSVNKVGQPATLVRMLNPTGDQIVLPVG